MKKYYFLLILLFTSPLLLYPCRCREVSAMEGVKNSDIVFKGRILSVVRTSKYEDAGLKVDTTGLDDMAKQMKSYAPLYVVLVKAERVYKGKNVSDTIKILTPVASMTCGYRYFEEGDDCIIYATSEHVPFLLGANSLTSVIPMPRVYPEQGMYWTNHCTRTQQWNREEEEEIILSVMETIKKRVCQN